MTPIEKMAFPIWQESMRSTVLSGRLESADPKTPTMELYKDHLAALAKAPKERSYRLRVEDCFDVARAALLALAEAELDYGTIAVGGTEITVNALTLNTHQAEVAFRAMLRQIAEVN